MQTTHKIPGDSAVRYAKYLTSTATRGDYYTRDGEIDQPVPSRWHGSTALLESLGLDAESPVERSDLRAVMQGLSPLTGEPLRPAGSNGTRVAGVELTFSPPKSVSALWAVSSPYRRAQIEAAHRRAVASALARTEREVALVRRRSGGVVRFERAKSLLAAEFVHTSSRLAQDKEAGGVPDPQVHSHLVLFAAERYDGGARRDRIAPALPLRPRARRLFPGRVRRRALAAGTGDRTPHRPRRALFRDSRRAGGTGERLVLSH